MLKRFMLLVCWLLLVLVDSVFTHDTPSSPFLLVNREFLDKFPVINREVRVEATLYNVGNESALDVTYEDNSWPSENFKLIQGSFSQVFPIIKMGENVTHHYVIKPLKHGSTRDIPSRIRYHSTGGPKSTVYSSSYRNFYVLSPSDYAIHVASHWPHWRNYGLLTIPTIVIPWISYMKFKKTISSPSL